MRAWAIGIGAVSVAVTVTILVRITRPPSLGTKASATVTGAATAHSDPTQEDADELAWDVLVRSGKDLTKPVTIDFFLYFEDGGHAGAACRTLGTSGFDTALYPPTAAEAQWRCIVSRTMVPSREAIHAVGEQLADEARKLSGEYEGWDPSPDVGAD